MQPYPVYGRFTESANSGQSSAAAPSPSTTVCIPVPTSTESTPAWPAPSCDSHPEQHRRHEIFNQNFHSLQPGAVSSPRLMPDQIFSSFSLANSSTPNLNTRHVSIADDQGYSLPTSVTSLDITRSASRSQIEFAFPEIPARPRKRHKVATSCNRCRQNKRGCDNGVPCFNCKKNNVDCCYTDAQLSRTAWGDSLLSQEKVIGVAAYRPKVLGTGRTAILPYHSLVPSEHRSTFDSRPTLDSHQHRSQQILTSQSRNLSKAIRVAHPGPQYPVRSYPNELLTASDGKQLSPIESRQASTLPSNSHSIITSNEHLQRVKATSVVHKQPSSESVWQQDLGDRSFPPIIHSQNQAMLELLQQQDQPNKVADRSSDESRYRDFHRHSYETQNLLPGHGEISHNFNMTVGEGSLTPLSTSSPVVSAPSMRFSTVDLGVKTPISLNYYTDQIPHDENTVYARQNPESDRPLSHVSLIESDLNRQYQHQHQPRSDDSPEFEGVLQQALPPFGSSSSPNSLSTVDPLHSFHSIVPVPSIIGVYSSQNSPLEPWDGSTFGSNEYTAPYTAVHQDNQNDNHHYTSTSHSSESTTPEEALAEENTKISKKMQKIARDMLAIKKYDLCIMIPRHISQDYDEFIIPLEMPSASSIKRIPNHLLLLPRDANYLVDVFFEHAYFYYPIVNRSIVELHLMEPQTPQALFLLNIIFMTACKHLARISDIKRAIQFRERAREVQFYIDDRSRLSRMQGLLLGSLVIYGVFKSVSSFAELCGVHRSLTNTPGISNKENGNLGGIQDLESDGQSTQDKNSNIPEAAYQARLWTFWGCYVRDSVARLYFGWPFGIDSMEVTSDLPKVEEHVGLGGNSGRIGLQSLVDEYSQTHSIIGKRRGSSFRRDSNKQSDKRQMTRPSEDPISNKTKVSDREEYRNTMPNSDDDDSGGDAEDRSTSRRKGKSAGQRGDFRGFSSDDEDAADQDRDERMSIPLSFESAGPRKGGPSIAQGAKYELFSVLSPKILEQQSQRGYNETLPSMIQSQTHHPGSPPSIPLPSDEQELNVHMKRMKLLVDAAEDTTDGGSFARVLFLEEIRLWTLGRRVALYLAGRSNNTAPSACPLPSTKGSTHSTTHETPMTTGARSTNRVLQSTLQNTGQWSQEAWLQDHELQSLQTDLIAWEEALPEHLRFRPDVDNDEINHKVNGKMSTLIMSYYTITILLQSSYLPISQYISSRNTPLQVPSAKSNNHAGPNEVGAEATKKVNSANNSDSTSLSNPTSTTSDGAQPSTAYFQHQAQSALQAEQQIPHGLEYFNTAHQICTELSNVLLHHVEMMLDSYPNWCSIQAKVNHAITAALRVSCLNAKLSSNSGPAREEAKAGFKMGTDLYKRLALLPYPLTIRDWPVEEDVQAMLEIEEEFKEMMMTQDKQQAALPSALSASPPETDRSDETVTVAEPTDTSVPENMAASNSIPSTAEHQIFGLEDGNFKFDFDQSL